MKKIWSNATLAFGEQKNGVWFSTAYPAPMFILKAECEKEAEQLFASLMGSLPRNEGEAEAAVNVIATYKMNEGWSIIVFPRRKHRPDCYFATGAEHRLVSPGALDMCGVLILAREEDYNAMTAEEAYSILQEVSLPAGDCLTVIETLATKR